MSPGLLLLLPFPFPLLLLPVLTAAARSSLAIVTLLFFLRRDIDIPAILYSL